MGLLLGGLVVALFPLPAEATPHPLPYSYPYETLPARKFEAEQYVDTIPMRVSTINADGTTGTTFALRSVLQTELEYGITDRLEFAWYFVFQQGGSAEASVLTFDGMKQRLRYRLGEAEQWPVNVGLYLEVAEFHDELELEQKILLSRRLGRFNLIANLWVEQEYNFQEREVEVFYNPTAGVALELSPHFFVGTEYWARGKFSDEAAASVSTHHYAGPTAMAQAGEYWLAIGAYLRLDDLGAGFPVDDAYGRFWVRAILGAGF